MVSVLGGVYNVLLRTISADTCDGGLKDSKDHAPVNRPVCIGEGFGIRHKAPPQPSARNKLSTISMFVPSRVLLTGRVKRKDY